MKRKKPARKLKLKKQPSYKALKAKAWKVFSEWVRKRGADEDGYASCVTCQKRFFWKDLQAGHFLSGRHNSVLFDPDGVFGQCLYCNVFLHGNQYAYGRWMEKKYGREFVDEMIRKSKQFLKLDRSDLEAIIEKYSNVSPNFSIDNPANSGGSD